MPRKARQPAKFKNKSSLLLRALITAAHKSGMNYRLLARATGMSKGELHLLEHGRMRDNVKSKAAVARALRGFLGQPVNCENAQAGTDVLRRHLAAIEGVERDMRAEIGNNSQGENHGR